MKRGHIRFERINGASTGTFQTSTGSDKGFGVFSGNFYSRLEVLYGIFSVLKWAACPA